MRRISLVLVLMLVCTPALADEPNLDREPQCGTMKGFGAGLAGAFYVVARTSVGILTTLVPNAGIRVDDRAQTYITASWPLQLTFGHASGREEIEFGECVKDYVEVFQVHRVVLEPMITGTYRAELIELGFDTRPAYRFLWHGLESDWGFGAGLGSTIQWLDGVRASLSGELLVQYGECCIPSYLTISLRYDRFFAGDARNLFGLSGGWTFW